MAPALSKSALLLAAMAAGAEAFAPPQALRPLAPRPLGPVKGTCSLRMNQGGDMEQISQEEYEELLRLAGQAQQKQQAAKPAASPFGGLFGGGARAAPQQSAAYDDDDYGELPPVSQQQAQQVAPPTPPAPEAPAPAPAAPANPFGGLFGGFGGGNQPQAQPDPAAAEAARLAEEQAAAQAAAQAAPPAPQQSNPFGGLFNAFAPKPAAPTTEEVELSAAEYNELLEATGQAKPNSLNARANAPRTKIQANWSAPRPKPAAKPAAPPPSAGVKVTTIRDGDRQNYPQPGDTLTMHYVGKLRSNKQVFDSSIDRGQPFTFTIGVGQVIQGWDEGVMQMCLGEKAQLVISADYGYGAAGQGPIPPNSELVFDVDLLAINGQKAGGRFAGAN